MIFGIIWHSISEMFFIIEKMDFLLVRHAYLRVFPKICI